APGARGGAPGAGGAPGTPGPSGPSGPATAGPDVTDLLTWDPAAGLDLPAASVVGLQGSVRLGPAADLRALLPALLPSLPLLADAAWTGSGPAGRREVLAALTRHPALWRAVGVPVQAREPDAAG
uniref:hypothetical protein n=1 Tax=Cellulomonas endophytica TaxID=2494735 RepID=UPI00196A514B